jgi:hypothetical protein
MTLHVIQTLADPLLNLLADDPVRPEIPAEFRVSDTSEIFVLQDEQTLEPQAVVCVAYRSLVPGNVLELAAMPTDDTHVAVFYTIWSYKPRAGRKLIQQTRAWINRNRKNITEFVTLSPPTDMARKFHLLNGAEVFRINTETVNYLYP